MTSSITCAGCKHAYVDSALFCPNCGRPKVRETVSDGLLGKVLGERFQVHEMIGQGASGTIYRAEHVTLRRKVAIKVLHEELSRDDLAVERFRREATTVAEIDNEHIVEIHDFGRTPDGRLYLAMELLEGETLDNVLLKEKTLSVERAADILIQVGEALMEAHAIGYVHRDLRPRNIFLAIRRGKANFVKLLDFGLAKLVESDASAASTSLGMTFGDPRYMSPEQARGDRIDRRADIYQLGCVAYEMLTGAPPFSGNRVFDILTKQVTEIPQPLPTRRPGVPLWMEAACAKMLAKDSENRFATTTRMVEALRRGLETGEVMEDEVARRRESIPPPSVSRVMQKMGLTEPSSTPVHVPLPPAPTPAPTADSIKQHNLPPVKASDTAKGVTAAKPDSVELLRKRTGTPQLGVPVVSAAAASPMPAEQPPVAGYIDRSQSVLVADQSASSSAEATRVRPATAPSARPPTDRPIDRPDLATPPTRPATDRPNESSVPAGRMKRPTAEPGISQVWYDEGDRDSDESGIDRERARKIISPSVTESLYDEEPPRGRRWSYAIAALAVLAIAGGIAFAVTRKGKDKENKLPATEPTPVAIMADAMPSTIISEPDAAVAVVPPPADATAVATKPDRTTGPTIRRDPGNGNPLDFTPPGSENPRRNPGDGSATPPPVVIITTPKEPADAGVTSGPQDPYGGGNDTPPTNDGTGEKKAEFYANLGTQQLGGGDTTSAASSFKKALELDPSNVIATIGMGEIALRQGLFGDAIAHLKKAARLAPRSSRVFTLLGEAYLNSGNNKEAAANFKKALQLDPDNTRARDGYNEASSRVPPSDE